MTYIGLYGALLLQGLVSTGRPSTRRLLYFISLIALFLFVAFRFKVGCDWIGYLRHYEMMRFQPLEAALERREPGYWSLVTLVHHLGLEYPYVNVFAGLIFFIGFHALAKRQPDPLGFLILSLPILIINLPMSAIRQASALGFLCLAYCAFIDRKVGRYVAFVLAGSLFHTSVVMFLMLAPFVKGGLTPRNIVIGLTLALPGGYFLLLDEVEFYADRYLESGVDAIGGPFRAALIFIVGLFFLLRLRQRWQLRFRADYDLIFIGSWIMLAVLPIALVSSVIGDRFGYYIMPLQLVILARFPYLYEGRDSILLYVSPYIGLGIVLLVWSAYSRLFQLCYLPYSSWLF